MAKTNFDCMLCNKQIKINTKGYHMGVCKNCVRLIKKDWPEKNVVVVTDDKPLEQLMNF